jgi:hypothetical protein
MRAFVSQSRQISTQIGKNLLKVHIMTLEFVFHKHLPFFAFNLVVEEVVDEVIVKMHSRKEEEKAKKISMKAALLEVIFQQIPCSRTTAIGEKKIGLSTLRHYATEVKARLEACLGQKVVSDDFLKQFRINNRQQLTLRQLRTALLKVSLSFNFNFRTFCFIKIYFPIG